MAYRPLGCTSSGYRCWVCIIGQVMATSDPTSYAIVVCRKGRMLGSWLIFTVYLGHVSYPGYAWMLKNSVNLIEFALAVEGLQLHTWCHDLLRSEAHFQAVQFPGTVALEEEDQPLFWPYWQHVPNQSLLVLSPTEVIK